MRSRFCARSRHADCNGTVSRSLIPQTYNPRECTCPCHTEDLSRYVEGMSDG